jgi:AAA domain
MRAASTYTSREPEADNMPRDANDILREEGVDALREFIDAAEPYNGNRRGREDDEFEKHFGEEQGNCSDDPPPPSGLADYDLNGIEAEAPEIVTPSTGLGEWDAGDDIATPPPRGWLLGNIFARKFMASLLADGGVGKTALRLAQLLSCAIGRSLTSDHVFERCRVLIISLEDDADELRRRILALMLHYKIDRSELKGWLFLSAPGAAGGKLMTADKSGRLTRGQLADNLVTVITARGIDLVSIDPFVKSHSVEENSNSAIDDVVQVLTDLAAKYDIAVDALHHTSKGAADPGNADRGRGASAMKDGARLVYTLAPMTTDEAQAFGIKDEDRRVLIRMDSAKVNIAPPLRAARWFRLVGVPLGNATATYPNGDEVQVVEPWTPPDTWAGLTHTLLNQILTAIDTGMPDRNRYSDASGVTDRAAWKVVLEHAPEVRYEYDNPVTRKPVKGLKLDTTKRPS